MNANELADLLEVDSWYKLVTREEIAAMLRQQQAEIEALKASHMELERGIVKDLNQRQSAEPVAWINREEGSGSILDWEKDPYSETNIPLYTHPAKTLTDDPLVNFKPVWQEKPELTLTDEEIHDLIVNKVTDYDMIKEALRKAQE